MRMVAGLIFVLSCVSCGSGGDSNNHGYGWEYDVQGASGLTLRYHPEAPRFPVQMFETAYNEAQECTGLTAPAPFVIIVSADSLPDVRGIYYSDPPLIAIEIWGIFKHEAIHYLLDHNTGNPDPAHSSELFAKCV